MKKKLFVVCCTVMLISGCATFETMFGTMFSESRNNFDEKINKIDDYLKTQNCQLEEYTERKGKEQFIIIPKAKYQILGNNNKFAIDNQVFLYGIIKADNIFKGQMNLMLQIALIIDKDTNTHLDYDGKDIKELSLTYDGKKLDLLSKTSNDTYLYGDALFKYSDTSIKILQEIANAKEITIEGRNVIGRKYTQKLTNKDIAMFKKMLTVVQNVHSILNN